MIPVSAQELAFFHHALIAIFALAGVTLVALLFITAPYGRHATRRWGPLLPGVVAWIVMELPAAVALPLCCAISPRPLDAATLALVALWELHYLHRTFVFPLRRRRSLHAMPIAIALMGFTFNVFNGWLNGRWLTAIGPLRDVSWLGDPRFLAGAIVFLCGFGMNVHSDEVLLHLRKPGETGYQIPRGGVYRFVSCPNYLGEILEWSGFALAAWSPAGLAFAVYTIANLLPRALAHHRWYRVKFIDYPPERRAIIPGLL